MIPVRIAIDARAQDVLEC